MECNNNDLYYTYSPDGKIKYNVYPWTTFNNPILPNEVRTQNNMGDPTLSQIGTCTNLDPLAFNQKVKCNPGSPGRDDATGLCTIKLPVQCFGPYGACSRNDQEGPIPCDDRLVKNEGGIWEYGPDRWEFPPGNPPIFAGTNMKNCQEETELGPLVYFNDGRQSFQGPRTCRPYTYQTKITPTYAENFSGELNVFGYWGAWGVYASSYQGNPLSDFRNIPSCYSSVYVSFFKIDKRDGELKVVASELQPCIGVTFPDDYNRVPHGPDCDENCDFCNKNLECCKWVPNNGSAQNLISQIQEWKSNAKPNRPRSVLASLGGGAGASVKQIFNEPDIVEKSGFVKTMIDFLISWGFDGIDIDYESIGGGSELGSNGSVIRKNWEFLLGGLKRCNPNIIISGAPFNNSYLGTFLEVANTGLMDLVSPQQYNDATLHQVENSATNPPGGNDLWTRSFSGIPDSKKGLLIPASINSATWPTGPPDGYPQKYHCWDMGRLANTIIYQNMNGNFGRPGKMNSVGIWEICQSAFFTGSSFEAAMDVIINNGSASSKEVVSLECCNIPITPTHRDCDKYRCWAPCVEAGDAGDGGVALVDGVWCNKWAHKAWGANTYYCGDGPNYNEQSGGIDCRPCKSCRQADDKWDIQQGCNDDQWCSSFGYCGKTDEYKNGGTQCGPRPGPKPGPNMYSCTPSGSSFTPCSLDPNCFQGKEGCYTTQEECQTGPQNSKACRITYNCVEGTCVEVLGINGVYYTMDECQSKCSKGIRPCNATECDEEQCPQSGAVLYCAGGQAKGGCASNWIDRPGCDNVCDTTNCHNRVRCDPTHPDARCPGGKPCPRDGICR